MGRREAPVPDGPLYEFAQGLRDLRANAPGSPAYRELARTAAYSASALSVAAAGRKLPTWEVTLAFVKACGGDVELWRERWTKLQVALRNTNPELVAEPVGDSLPDDPAALVDPLSTAVLSPLSDTDPTRIGPFRLLGRLGGGAMGVVYLGRPRGGGSPVAVKVIRPHLAEDPGFRRRFAAEVVTARRVHGPYTPVVVDADPAAKFPWMATAYVPGPSVGETVAVSGPLPPTAVRALAAGVGQALVCIHAAGVLHRDLKPANVLLDADGPKVIDFGVAQAADASRLTQTGARVGTVPFMAPEQADGRPVTGAADVFALGSVLAYASTGVAPFGEGATGEVLYRIVHTDPDPAALACPDTQLRDLIARCLDKDPARRPTPVEVVAECAGDRPQSTWLPAPTAARTARRSAEVSGLLRRAGGRRRLAVRVAAVAVPVLVAAATGAVIDGALRPAAPQAASGYVAAYLDRRLQLPNYDWYVDLVAGTVVAGHGGWTLSTNAGGNSKGAFELSDDTDAYVPPPGTAATADACAAGIVEQPTRTVRFPQVPPGRWFCLKSRISHDLAVVKVIDTDDGNWGAKLAIDYYEHS